MFLRSVLYFLSPHHRFFEPHVVSSKQVVVRKPAQQLHAERQASRLPFRVRVRFRYSLLPPLFSFSAFLRLTYLEPTKSRIDSGSRGTGTEWSNRHSTGRPDSLVSLMKTSSSWSLSPRVLGSITLSRRMCALFYQFALCEKPAYWPARHTMC